MHVSMTNALLLVVQDLACRRGGRLLFTDVDFAVAQGQALWLRGVNGCGKSSLLRLLAGLVLPQAGRIEAAVRPAYLGHDAALKPTRTIRQELGFWRDLSGPVALSLEQAADRAGLTSLLDAPCRLLSSGQRRRAALARLYQQAAPLWLMDEPAVGLDSASRAALVAAMSAHMADGGAIVFTSHEALDVPAGVLELDRFVPAVLTEPAV